MGENETVDTGYDEFCIALDAHPALGYLANMNLWNVLVRTMRTWWQALSSLVLLNTAWMLLRFPLVTAPIATAVFAALIHELVSEGDFNYATIWPLVQRLWSASLRWGAVNFVVWGILIGNLLLSAQAEGAIWWVLRSVWVIMAVLWWSVGLYFWPLFFDMQHPKVTTALRRSAVFVFTRPGLSLGGALLAALLLIFSTLLTFFLVVAWMSWSALLAEYAVRAELARLDTLKSGEGTP